MPTRIIALGLAALATAGSGVVAILTAAGPAAANASCLSDFTSRTQFNREQNAPNVTITQSNIDIYEGDILLLATNESQYTFLLASCVAATPGTPM